MFKKILASLVLFGAAFTTNAAVIDFESMGVQGSVNPYYNRAGFTTDGFNFSTNMDVIDVSSTGGWWANGVGANHSGQYAALNDFGGDMIMTQVGGGFFSVGNLSLNGWQGGQSNITISGLYNGSVVNSVTALIGSPWLNIVTNFSNIDTLRISGGTFLVDDISVNGGSSSPSAVPVPAAVWLFGSGIAGLIGARKRKKTVAAVTA